jgi:hypothetical protein
MIFKFLNFIASNVLVCVELKTKDDNRLIYFVDYN